MGKLAQSLLGLWTLLVGVASAEARNPPQYVFLVDISASMIGQEDGSTVIFPQVQRELMRFAERVVDEAEIRIVPFSQEPQGVVRFVLPREREEMLRYIRSLRAKGGSSFIYRSVNKAYDELCSEPRAFYLFTDGLDNSAEPARMPEQKSFCPLTLVASGRLPQDFADSWKGLRQNNLVDRPPSPSLQTTPTQPNLLANRQENSASETPGLPLSPADSPSRAGIVQAGCRRNMARNPAPSPLQAPNPPALEPGPLPPSQEPRRPPLHPHKPHHRHPGPPKPLHRHPGLSRAQDPLRQRPR